MGRLPDTCGNREHCIKLSFETGLTFKHLFPFLLQGCRTGFFLLLPLVHDAACSADFFSQRLQPGLERIRRTKFAFPDCNDVPSKGFEVCRGHLITVLVALDLRLPELHVGLRLRCIAATFVAMPEASIDHD